MPRRYSKNNPPALPAGVYETGRDQLTPKELQHLLRQDWTGEVLRGDPNDPGEYGNDEKPGKGVRVTRKSIAAPDTFTVHGFFFAHGKYRYYEADIDINAIKDADSLLLLVEQLNASFEKAAVTMGRED